MDLKLLWIIQLAPLAAFLLIQLLPKSLKKIAPAIGILGALTAALASSQLFLVHADGYGLPEQFIYPWLSVSDRPLWPNVHMPSYTLAVGFLMDRLNLLMI